MNPTTVVALLVLAASGGASGAVLVRSPARLAGWFLAAGAASLVAGTAAWAIQPTVARTLFVATGALLWPAAFLAYPRPAGRHPVEGAAWSVVAAVGIAVVVSSLVGREVLDGAVGVAVLVTGPVLIGHLVWRYERATEANRVLLLWLGLATGTVALAYGVLSFAVPNRGVMVAGLLLTALVPPVLAGAVRQPATVDVRGLVVQAVVFAVAVLAYVSVFCGLAAALELLGADGQQLGLLAVLAAIAAAGFHPVRVGMRGVVDELLFGGRPDPLDAASQLANRIGDDPALALGAIREALVLPYTSLQVAGEELASSGTPVPHTRRLALPLGDDTPGEIVVGLRPGDLSLTEADERVLRIVAPLLALTLRARSLAAELATSRGQAIAAIEEERRRIRRDLHDGLGPTLSGIAFTADAARNSLAEPATAEELLRTLRADAVGAIGEVRRLVYAMRPPALDELGLVPALRQWAVQVRTADGRPLRVDIDAPDDLTGLPAAVEVAVYRITVEALTNAARHSGSDRAAVQLARVNGSLTVEVCDGGTARGPWTTGVGVSSMRERAAEIGGTLSAAPTERGGQVTAVLPVA